MRLLVLALVVGACSLVSQLSHANTYSSRQYYGGWNKHNTKNYYYRTYYYKPNKDYYGYKHHYVIAPQKKAYSGHYYYYNPYKKAFWGRVPCSCEGKPAYEILKEEDRKDDVEKIPEKAFNKMDKMPPIPDSKDDVPMDLPPDDAPPVAMD